ncbi:retropepsin-like aspartic protease family protein [Stakelama pacifica]|uniref:Aspartyl protease family protein n=1 Tax=Stakelama pacifica TaxID=517720 RepID=A0A4R6FZX2_9SPHN|nr:TIGR02281 family clan AA aspartic protease [Stakelama pacifica]TDN86735.1 aspartyl protease family protein [Stakelama pacifica]GGO90516.1 aspartyl protease [Stakelama pacifica]
MSDDQSLSAIWYIGALILVLSALFARRPGIGAILRSLIGWAIIAGAVYMVVEQRDTLARLAERFGIGGQSVEGGTTRIEMGPDGHFWARVELNGVSRRMLIDSGATTTALSQATADAASIETSGGGFPVMLSTANGQILAKRATIRSITLGNLHADNLDAVVSDRFGDLDVIGMNFLSRLGSWRVEGRTLILEPADTSEHEAARPSVLDQS